MEIFVILQLSNCFAISGDSKKKEKKIPQQKVIVVPQDMAMRYHTAGVMERNGAAESCHVVFLL